LHLIRKLVGWMFGWVMILSAGASSAVKTRAALQLENIALRHQIGVLQRSAKKPPQLYTPDRLLWVWLSRVWADWRSALVIVKPETVIAWHRKAFRLFWTWNDPEGEARAAAGPTRSPRSYPPHEQRKPGLGSTAYSWRASEARHQRRGDKREQISRA
jgi:hypothetical protein